MRCINNWISKYVILLVILSINHKHGISQETDPFKDKYLIVLDVQQQFCDKSKMDSLSLEIIPTINSVIESFPQERVIYVKAIGKVINISFKGISVDTVQAPEFAKGLQIVNTNIITKIEDDAFKSSELIHYLENNNAREIVLIGLMAEECISETALGGLKGGYIIKIVPEAIISRNDKKKKRAINKLKEQGVLLYPMSQVLGVP
ncbi:MAG: hypothetical protein CL840_13690 [Crocinitomicaceae bacterium]|nr:hypothetical protein [Crocinitomicaceae bacterium]|tara:strand:+ start:7068 stop:7682 length:615 start_codon:yes stop_codon:yes gene_type:complete